MKRIYYGQAGHFCAADDCRFHIHTHVGGFCISTVGDYRPTRSAEQEEIGAGRLYETMVFPLNDARDGLASLENIDFAAYNDRDAANVGHERMVQKFEAKAVDAFVLEGAR